MRPECVASTFCERLALTYAPVGFGLVESAPADAMPLRPGRLGCLVPPILASARGAVLAVRRETCGWPCSAFYLGFSDSIFPGVDELIGAALFIGLYVVELALWAGERPEVLLWFALFGGLSGVIGLGAARAWQADRTLKAVEPVPTGEGAR